MAEPPTQENNTAAMTNRASDLPHDAVSSLPPELLLEISKNLPTKYVKRDLYNLCLVKPFVPAATEQLYSQCWNFCPILFLRTILRRPGLAALIRDITLVRYSSTRELPALTVDDTETFVNAIKKLHLYQQDEDRWIRYLKSKPDYGYTHSAPLLALILLHTPNVTNIDLDWDAWPMPSCYGEGPSSRPQYYFAWWEVAFPRPNLRFSTQPAMNYRNLQSVGVSDDVLNLVSIASFFRVDTLKKLHISGEEDADSAGLDDAELAALFRSNTSNIKHLQIFGGPVASHVLSTMISCCKRLDTFSYQGFTSSSGNFDYALIESALRQHQSTLWALEICNARSYIAQKWDWSAFENLDTMIIDFDGIMPSDMDEHRLAFVLPSSIQRLRLTGVSLKNSDFLKDLLRCAGPLSPLRDKTIFPQLRDLSLAIWDLCEEDLDGMEYVRMTCELRKRGVRVGFYEMDNLFLLDSWI